MSDYVMQVFLSDCRAYFSMKIPQFITVKEVAHVRKLFALQMKVVERHARRTEEMIYKAMPLGSPADLVFGAPESLERIRSELDPTPPTSLPPAKQS
jgi:hypothetical protein